MQSVGGKVVVPPPPFEKVATLTLTAEEFFVNALKVGSYLYAGIAISPGRIIKINLATFEREATLTLDTGENGVQDLVVVDDYLYVALATIPGKVAKIDLSTFTKVTTLTFESGENYPRALASDGTYLYAGLDVIPAKVIKIDLTTFTKVSTLDTEESDTLGVYALAISGAYLYAGLYFQPGRVVKINLSTFTKVATLTFDDGERSVTGLLAVGDYLYASLNTTPAKVVKINLSTFTKEATLTLDTGEDYAYTGLAAYETSYLYVGTYTSPAIIAKISIATFSEVDALTLDAGESSLRSIHVHGNYIYVGTYTFPARIVKVGVGEGGEGEEAPPPPPPPPPPTEIRIENVGTPADIDTTPYTMTGSETIAITEANMLIVQVMVKGAYAISSITHNGKPLTQLRADGWAVGGARTFIWGRVNPDVGTYDIVITFSAACEAIACAMGLTGVNTADPVGATAGTSGYGGTPSIVITTLYDNSWIVSHIGCATNNDPTPDPSQTERWELIVSGAPLGRKSGNGTTELKATAGSDTQRWTGTFDEWSVSCVEIRVGE